MAKKAGKPGGLEAERLISCKTGGLL